MKEEERWKNRRMKKRLEVSLFRVDEFIKFNEKLLVWVSNTTNAYLRLLLVKITFQLSCPFT